MQIKNFLQNNKLFIEKNFINNDWVDADSGEVVQVVNPFDQSILGTIPNGGTFEAKRAVAVAQDAFHTWSKLTALQRANYLIAWADLLSKSIEDVATIMTLEHGKSLLECRAEVQFSINILHWFAEQARRVYGEIIPANSANQRILILKQPIGVVGLISPWNFPLATLIRKAAPALASGCTVVAKPAELTPYSALSAAYLAKEAGLPAGVFNLVTGSPQKIGEVLTTHPDVKAFSFTGSTAVGKLLQKQCADTVKKVSLELGGNSPLIVFDDADLDCAIKGTLATKFRNMGQTCVCANRIFVQDKIYDQFVTAFTKEAGKLTLGNGLEQGVEQGPLINQAAVDKITRLINDAVSKGAKLLCGGQVPAHLGGTFFEPTVLVNANNTMDLSKEEIFGPVAVIYKFFSEEEVIKQANNTSYGLASFVFTNNLQRAFRMMDAIEAGVVSINEGVFTSEVAPFGGCKESGNGREGGKEGMEEYLEIKYVCFGNIK
jgi:succinate-semialdehyde dehydrogenase / glutarate-semialdehyde dehydrogenase